MFTSPIQIPVGLANLLSPGEHARPVEGASRYWVTTEGRVLSTCSGVATVTTPGVQTRGYAQALIYDDDGVRRRPLVHVLVAGAFLSPLPVGPGTVVDVHHVNGDKLDNRPSNLAYVTREEHARLELAKGGRGNQKLTAAAVWTARCRALSVGTAEAAQDLVDQHDVRPRTARKVIRGRSWAWVPMPTETVATSQLARTLAVSEDEAGRLLSLAPGRLAA